MSRLSKYLKQDTTFQPVVRDITGKPLLNEYGVPEYGAVVQVKCRKETMAVQAETGLGKYLSLGLTFYVDDSIKPQSSDLMDSKTILEVVDYIDGSGVLIGYEVHT